MHGYDVDELIGKDPRILAPRTAWNDIETPLNEYVASLRESMNLRKDGSEFPVYLISMPLIDRGGTSMGVVSVCEDITERKEVEEKLRYMSTHDSLTGLYNRAYFELELQRLMRSRLFPVSVIMIDVNGLKVVNDRDGHMTGDMLLKDVGRVLSGIFRAEDMVARIGGDEFIILLPETDRETLEKAIERIRDVLAEENEREGVPEVSLSLGSATACEAGMLLDSIKQADAEMYQDKVSNFCSDRSRQ
jgi:diguanylate cyclase (GGDEF)-like protein